MKHAANSLNASALYEGTFSVGLDKKFNRIDRDDAPAKGALKISLNPFLIRAEQRNYLFDAGIGDFGEDTTTDTIKENLDARGLTEYDITDIFASHLHYDHIGGLAGNAEGHWQLTFPEARLWVSRAGWKKALNQEKYYDEEKTEFLHFLDAKADLHFLDAEDQPYPDMEVRTIGGHTEHSLVLLYDDGASKYLMAGDVLATRGEVNRKFAAKYDFDPDRSMEARRELTHMAFEEQYVVMGYHDSHHPLFKLTAYDENQGYTIKAMEAHVTA